MDETREEEELGEVIDIREWMAGIPQEERTFYLKDDHAEVVAAFSEAGYDGEIWFKLKALTEADRDEREAMPVRFEMESGEVVQRWGVDRGALIDFNLEKMVVDAEFPIFRNGKPRRFRWDKAAGRVPKNIERVRESRKLYRWLMDKIDEMEPDSEVVEEAGNSSETQVEPPQ